VEEQTHTSVSTFLSVIGTALGFWLFLSGGLPRQAPYSSHAIPQPVAVESVTHYEIAKRNGPAMDACVQPGHWHARDEDDSQKWQGIERSDCALAWLSR
jgi:hypothetical protein